MKISYAPNFKKSFRRLPKKVRNKFRKQINFLLRNFRHPSLNSKKYDKEKGIWQARVNRNYRFYFLMEGDTYILLEIKTHPQ